MTTKYSYARENENAKLVKTKWIIKAVLVFLLRQIPSFSSSRSCVWKRFRSSEGQPLHIWTSWRQIINDVIRCTSDAALTAKAPQCWFLWKNTIPVWCNYSQTGRQASLIWLEISSACTRAPWTITVPHRLTKLAKTLLQKSLHRTFWGLRVSLWGSAWAKRCAAALNIKQINEPLIMMKTGKRNMQMCDKTPQLDWN